MKKIIIMLMMFFSFAGFAQNDNFDMLGMSCLTAPTASITSGYYTVCPGDTVHIPVTLTNGAPTWDITYSNGINSWTVNNITTSPYDLVISLNTPGTYTYIITQVSAGGMYGTTSGFATVTVTTLPQIFTLSCDTTTFCSNSTSSHFELSGSVSGVQYYLVVAGTTTPIPGTTIYGNGGTLPWPGLSTVGNYQCIAQNSTGCTSVMNGIIPLTTIASPGNAGTIYASTTTICAGGSITFATTGAIGATTYGWSFPSGCTVTSPSSTLSSITIQFGNVGGNVTVSGFNSCGGGLPATISVTVLPVPNLISVTANPTDVCVGATTSLTANTIGSGYTFVWTDNFGNTLGTNYQISPTLPVGPNNCHVTVTGSNQCFVTGSVMVTVHALPIVTLALTPASVCENGTVVEVGGGSPLGGHYTGNCLYNGTDSVVPSATNVGTYAISYYYTDGWGCTGQSAPYSFTVYESPDVNFYSIYPWSYIPLNTPPIPLTTGTPVALNPSNGVYSGDGVSLVGTTYYFTAADAGIGLHPLTYTYTDPLSGCWGTELQYAQVGDPSGLDEVITLNNVIIYPNPATEVLNLTGINTGEISTLKIVNMIGEVVYTTAINTESMIIRVADLTTGTYIIWFEDAKGNSLQHHYFIKK